MEAVSYTHLEVSKIMIALNADLQTIDEAIRNQCQMLITHHPFLLDPIVNIDQDDFMGAFIFKAIEHHIVVYSSHTALDNVAMNEWLMEALGVHDIQRGEDAVSYTHLDVYKRQPSSCGTCKSSYFTTYKKTK